MNAKMLGATGLVALTTALIPLAIPTARAGVHPSGSLGVLVAADTAVAQYIVQRRTTYRPSYGGYGVPSYVVPGNSYVVTQPRTYYSTPYAAPVYGGYPSYAAPVYGGYPGHYNGGYGGYPGGYYNGGYGAYGGFGRGINIPLGGGRGISIGGF